MGNLPVQEGRASKTYPLPALILCFGILTVRVRSARVVPALRPKSLPPGSSRYEELGPGHE